MKQQAFIAGAGRSRVGKLQILDVDSLLSEALANALVNAGMELKELDGLIVCPSLADPKFMAAHTLAMKLMIYPNLVYCLTLDTGGASPVSGLLLAQKLIESKIVKKAVAVVAGDAVYSLGTSDLLARAGKSINHPNYQDFTQPVIPILYDLVAQWHMSTYGTRREQLAMVPVLMSRQGIRHPDAMNKKVLTLNDILSSRQVAPVTNVLECARPIDGAGAIIMVPADRANDCRFSAISIDGGGEGAGPLFPLSNISDQMFSAGKVAKAVLKKAGISRINDIKFFGIYDCFPICFLKFIEDAGLCPKGVGGEWIEGIYYSYTDNSPTDDFPINTHGGLLSFGAPWEAPAIFSIIEAVEQMRGQAGVRQLKASSPALIYGNGGIFTSSAIAVLSKF